MSLKTSKTLLALAVAAAAASPLASQAQDGPWLVRLRAVHLDSANKDSTGLDLSINDKVIPEVDVSYFFTPEFAAELVLTYPQKHKLRSGGTEIGSLKHLPPTFTLQYHFTRLGAFKPYVGAGVNYTRSVVEVYRDGKYLGELNPRIDFYFDSQQTMTIPGQRSTLKDDLYILLVDWEPASAIGATFKVYVNPLVNWLWLGSLLFLVGIIIAAWPESEKEPAAIKVRSRSQHTSAAD